MSPAVVVVDDRAPSSPWSTFERVQHALAAGARVRLRPTPTGGFDLVRNGSAVLATDFDGAPIGTYADAGAAVQAWRDRRGVASRIEGARHDDA